MAIFRVWAPFVKSVQVKIDYQKISLQPSQPGWWEVDVPAAGPGTDYAFVLDNQEPPLPDPRSLWQPYGVHGASRLIDPDEFKWSDAGWQQPPLPSAVIYELHIGTFTPEGTFEAAIGKLAYLKDLGITHIELMPVNEFAGERGWGYDGVNIFAPHHAYGGPAGLQRLVDACHANGLGVILDVIYNHLGPEGNYLGRFGPYFTDRYNTPWGQGINFDGPGSDEVRRYLIDNALMWARDYHVDGLRLDAVHTMIDRSATHFLEELAREVHCMGILLGKHKYVLAESDLNDPRLVRPVEVGGYELDAVWSDDLHHALHTVLTGEDSGYYEDFGEWEHLKRALEETYIYAGSYSKTRGRRHGRRATDLPPYRFLAYLQNHDQIGNRARGDRLSETLNADQLKIGAALILASPFIPMIFMGEEWCASSPFQFFSDFQDRDLGRMVTEGRRKEFAAFGWDAEAVPDPQAAATFRRSKLNWSEAEQGQHAEMLAWTRCLMHLRRKLPRQYPTSDWFTSPEVSYDESAGWFLMVRGPLTVAGNFSKAEQAIELGSPGDLQVLLASKEGVQLSDASVQLPAECVALLIH